MVRIGVRGREAGYAPSATAIAIPPSTTETTWFDSTNSDLKVTEAIVVCEDNERTGKHSTQTVCVELFRCVLSVTFPRPCAASFVLKKRLSVIASGVFLLTCKR